jgi:hypothetical protein
VKPFVDPGTPAESVAEVVRLLEAEHQPHFVYRGQVRAWPGPLFPSAFRRYVQHGRTYDARDRLPRQPLRGAGRMFVEVEPLNYFHEFADSSGPARLSWVELQAIEHLVDNAELAWSLAVDGDAALVDRVPEPLRGLCAANRLGWQTVIDQFHRDRIRQLLCLNGFGFVLGMALAQHYGFSSEALDVTHDPRVAAFFASRNGPRYIEPEPSGVGVIYRFRLSNEELTQAGWEDRDFYTAPTYVTLGWIVGTMCVPHLSVAASAASLTGHVLQALEGGLAGRRAHAIKVGTNAFGQTRIVAQQAALLLPDMLFEERQHPAMKLRTFMAVEDLSSRDGFDAFYFRHSTEPALLPNLTRERLWPADDMFAQMFAMLLGPASPQVFHPTGMVLPRRRDLVDPGYTS